MFQSALYRNSDEHHGLDTICNELLEHLVLLEQQQ